MAADRVMPPIAGRIEDTEGLCLVSKSIAVLINNDYTLGQGERKISHQVVVLGKLVNSLLFARFNIRRTSSFKSSSNQRCNDVQS